MGNNGRSSELGRPPALAALPAIFKDLVRLLQVPGLDISVPQPRLLSTSGGSLHVGWQGHHQTYACQYTPSSTPRAVEIALLNLESGARSHPLLVAPYLSEERLQQLESRGISGLDLCGNCLLLGPRFVIWRSGNPNRFSESRPLKNVFRGRSSIFSRCFLLRSEFPSLTALRDFAQQRLSQPQQPSGGSLCLTLGTASKVVHTLEEQLLVARDQRSLKRLDLRGLMDLLLRNHRWTQGRRIRGKAAHPEALFRLDRRARFRSINTGVASAAHYGVLSPPDVRSVYVSDVDAAARAVDFKETEVFPRLELIDEASELVYFDGRSDGEQLWASPLQVWIELANGGPRERDAAQRLAAALHGGQFEEV